MKAYTVASIAFDRTLISIRSLNTNWLIRLCHAAVLLLFLASIFFVLWFWNRLPMHIPLWYTNPWGKERLADSYWLLATPFLGIFWHLVNTLTSAWISREYLVFSQLMMITSFLVHVLVFMIVVNVILLTI